MLEESSGKYMELYGVKPEMKAGIHHGKIIAGEVGVIKRDIVFSGDVLNTTSRIQNLCNQFEVNLILSKSTADLLNLELYQSVDLGAINLKGKSGSMKLIALMTYKESEGIKS